MDIACGSSARSQRNLSRMRVFWPSPGTACVP